MDPTMRSRQLAHAVRAFVDGSGRRRDLPATLQIGQPMGAFLQILDEDWYEPGLRADLVERALCCLDDAETIAWLTRAGDDHPHDVDHAWCAATIAAGLRLRREVGFYVVTRRGWTELQTGRSRTWSRVRPKRLLKW